MTTDISFLIKNYVKLQSVEFLPEIKLYTADDHYFHSLLKQETNNEYVAYPQWVHAWAGGRGLARFILDNPNLVKGKVVVDHASGSGIVGIAAALAGATVTCVDNDPYALQSIEINAKANNVDLNISDKLVDAEILTAGCPWFKKLDGTLIQKELDTIKSYDSVYLGYKLLRGEYYNGFFDKNQFEILERYVIPTEVYTEGVTSRDVIILTHKKGE